MLNGGRWDVLHRGFFDRPVLTVAPKLLGCVLAHETGDGLVAAEIVEAEAYRGELDPASHAFRGKTARNAVMYGEPGHAYVYFTYGMHFCVNLVCQQPGEAAAVLLRAGRVVEGVDLAAKRRAARSAAERELARGPARLCQALAIGRAENGADVCDPASPLRVLGRGVRGPRMSGKGMPGPELAGPAVSGPAGFDGLPARAISSGPRVGVRLGAEESWRFWITDEPAVSVYRPHMPKRRLSAATCPSRFAPAALGNLSRRAGTVGGSMQR
jgi:DNA-3-methyladenine glycosylase